MDTPGWFYNVSPISLHYTDASSLKRVRIIVYKIGSSKDFVKFEKIKISAKAHTSF